MKSQYFFLLDTKIDPNEKLRHLVYRHGHILVKQTLRMGTLLLYPYLRSCLTCINGVRKTL